MKRLVSASVMALIAMSGSALALSLGSGWNYDVSNVGGLSDQSIAGFYDFSLSQSAVFSYTDALNGDDRYEIWNGDRATGTKIHTSTLIAGNPFGDAADGRQAALDRGWANGTYHGGQVFLTPGVYSLKIYATAYRRGGLGARLDPVPVPAGLPLMATGIAALGLAARRKRRR